MTTATDSNADIAIILPRIGGGTARHAMEMFEAYSKAWHGVVYIEYIGRMFFVDMNSTHGIFTFVSDSNNKNLEKILAAANVKIIHIHHLLLADKSFLKFIKETSIPFAITLHDYFTVCPSIKLISDGVTYCGEPDINGCCDCWRLNDNFNFKFKDITEWRDFYHNILTLSSYVFAPSEDVKNRVEKYYPDLEIKVFENPEMATPALNLTVYPSKANSKKSCINVGLIGTMSPSKGADVLLRVAEEAISKEYDINFTLFGALELEKSFVLPQNINVLGKYREEEIFSLISCHQIDYFWFPAQCPETYSYVLTIPIRMGIPVFGVDLGAIGERISKNSWGETYQWDMPPSKLLEVLLKFDYDFYRQRVENFIIRNDHFPSPEVLYNKTLLQKNHGDFEDNNMPELLEQMQNDAKRDVLGLRKLTIPEFKFLFMNFNSWFARMIFCIHLDPSEALNYMRKRGVNVVIKKIQGLFSQD